MKPLRIFRASSDCNPCGSGSRQTVSSTTPCVPAPGSAIICDPAYYALLKAAAGQMLIVPVGSNCQAFLKPGTAGQRGFVFMGNDGQVYVEPAPSLTLPIINPIDGVTVEMPGSWPYIIIGTGVDPHNWRFVAPPTAGEFSVVAENGVFRLKDLTQSSGQTAVCGSDTAVAKVRLFGCLQTGLNDDDEPVYGLRKLTASHERVVVGDIEEDGTQGFKCLPIDERLKHPLATLKEFRASTWKQVNADTDAVEGDGFPDAILAGVGAIVDGKLLMWSAATGKYYKLPARVRSTITVDGDVAVADNGAYVSMGAHGLWSNVQVNLPDLFLACTIRMANDADNYTAIDYGLFIDNVQVHTWDVKGKPDVTLTHLLTGIAVGVHTFEIRFRQTAGAGASAIKYSNGQLFNVL
jgi:hypothetical protein